HRAKSFVLMPCRSRRQGSPRSSGMVGRGAGQGMLQGGTAQLSTNELFCEQQNESIGRMLSGYSIPWGLIRYKCYQRFTYSWSIPNGCPMWILQCLARVKNISFPEALMGSLSSTHFHIHETCRIWVWLRPQPPF
uniref:Uncharacterized protein n=1 Tax=Bubo bubo TaxID=30461 RepID=A0A8C0FSR4_BUBBB